MTILLASWVAAFLLAWIIGAAKGRPGAGFALGLFLGWFGVLFAAFLKPTVSAQGRYPCPFCAEAILPAAKVCPHCHNALPRLPTPPVVEDGTF